jgi:hypothetical protein
VRSAHRKLAEGWLKEERWQEDRGRKMFLPENVLASK